MAGKILVMEIVVDEKGNRQYIIDGEEYMKIAEGKKATSKETVDTNVYKRVR